MSHYDSCQLQQFSTFLTFYRANYYCIMLGDHNQTENKTRTTGAFFQETIPVITFIRYHHIYFIVTKLINRFSF